MSNLSSASTSSSPRISRFVVQSSDVLEDARINILDESNNVIWFKERFLGDNEIVEHVMHNASSTVCWTIHRPLRGWYIRIRSPTFPPGVFIPISPVPPSSPHYAEAALSFRSRTGLPSAKDAPVPSHVSRTESTSTVHSYPPTPPSLPSLVLQPPSPPTSPPSSSKELSNESSRPKSSWKSSSVTEFVVAPYLPSATAPSLFSRILSAMRDYDTLGSNSFTISRIAYQAPPPHVPATAGAAAHPLSSTDSLTSVKCLPLVTFRDRTSFLTARSMNGFLEIDQAEERLLGVDTSFWVTVALTYLDFLNDRGGRPRAGSTMHPELPLSPTSLRPNSGSYNHDSQPGSDHTDPIAYQKHIFDPPYFPPLNAGDEFDIFDIELQVDSGGKAELTVRTRHGSNARPIYKTEKSVRSHLLGKKHINIVVHRSEAWDSAKGENFPQKTKAHKYHPIWEGYGQSIRDLTVNATANTVLVGTSHGRTFTMSPHCGSYDPQRSRLPQPRDCFSHHFFPIHTTKFESSRRQAKSFSSQGSVSSDTQTTPNALTKPYAGGGYFIFDCHSQGRNELLTTLYCTGYDKRHRVRDGDIALAELRLPVLPTVDVSKSSQPTWGRFMKERHATLHISRRGMEAVFNGSHVNMTVPNAQAGSRYSLSRGQGQEIVIATVSMMLLSIETDGIEKKWQWMNNRIALENSIGKGSSSLSVVYDAEKVSLGDNASSIREMASDDRSIIDPWTAPPYPPSARGTEELAVLRASDGSPVSELTGEEPFTPVEESTIYPENPGYVIHAQSPSFNSVQEEEYRQRVTLEDAYQNGGNGNEHKDHLHVEIPHPPPHSPYPFHSPTTDQVPIVQFSPAPVSIPLQPTTFYSSQQSLKPAPEQVFSPQLQRLQPTPQNGLPFPPLPSQSHAQAPPPPVAERLPVPLPVPVHPASLTSWAEDSRPVVDNDTLGEYSRKEGPKVTGRPKPGVDGGIYW
ncbi:hypothetical protein V5O48_002795 [Marasmius crinis-equi]|uniref:Uncharacterized protein n=1 Tax=Marasmius crinis-equi TaxID=585013 RepID=A0ABR3FUQ4_9AGAR